MNPRINIIGVAISLSFLLAGCVSQLGEHSLVIPTTSLPADQRVVGFSITLSNACFASFPVVPVGWSFDILNEPSWQGRIQGSIIVGAAAIDKNDPFFRRPMRIRFGPQEIGPSNSECRILLYTTKDFDPDHTQDNVTIIQLRR